LPSTAEEIFPESETGSECDVFPESDDEHHVACEKSEIFHSSLTFHQKNIQRKVLIYSTFPCFFNFPIQKT
jgi:hypothetical protein